MQTIITRACNELGIKPIPSKRVCSMIYCGISIANGGISVCVFCTF